jgi:hypothetical protein
LWVKLNEQITFWVNFPNGSHIYLNWTIVDPVGQVKQAVKTPSQVGSVGDERMD